jgi:hypothetical protein
MSRNIIFVFLCSDSVENSRAFNLIQGARIMTSGVPSILPKKSEASIQEIRLSALLLTVWPVMLKYFVFKSQQDSEVNSFLLCPFPFSIKTCMGHPD